MEPTKESKTKAKKSRASKSSRRPLTKTPSLYAGSPSSLLQSDQTHESGAVGSTDSSPASGQIASLLKTTTSSAGGAPVVEPCHLPPPPDSCDRSSTKRRGSRPAAEAAALGASEARQPPRKPSRKPEGHSIILQPLSQQQAELKTESPEYHGAKPSSDELAGTKPGAQPEAQPGETKQVDGHAQTRGEVLTVVQEVMHPETNPSANLEPTQDTKDGAKHDKAQAGQEQSAAPQGVQVQTDGSPLTGSHPGTSDVATQHTPAAAMAPPVVRLAATVDTGTDTPLGLWAGSGSIVPELPFASPEYKLPAKAATAKMAAAGARQPVDKKRIESATNAVSSVGRKSGPATTELGGIASTEATVMFDVNPYVRFPLLVMNLILWLIGLTLVLVGAYAYVDTWTQSEVPTHKIYNVLSMFLIKMEITVMLFGMVTMSLSFCGCVGALRENTCLLNVYSSFITALLLINLVAGLMVFFLPSQIKRLLSETFSMELVVHYRDSSDFQRLMDNIQESMQCCGISRKNFRDWNANMYFNCSRANPSNERCSVPYSCCKRNSTDQVVSLSCGRNVLNMTDYDAWFQVYTGNCLDSAHRYVRDNVTIITGICLVFVILLAFVQMVTQALIDEILIIRRIYEKFYERAYDLRVAQEPTEPSAN